MKALVKIHENSPTLAAVHGHCMAAPRAPNYTLDCSRLGLLLLLSLSLTPIQLLFRSVATLDGLEHLSWKIVPTLAAAAYEHNFGDFFGKG